MSHLILFLPLSLLLIGNGNVTPIRSIQTGSRKISSLTKKDQRLSHFSKLAVTVLKGIKETNRLLIAINVACMVATLTPGAREALIINARLIKRQQEFMIRTIQTLLRLHRIRGGSARTLNSYRQAQVGTCAIPGTLHWRGSSETAIYRLREEQAGVCVYGDRKSPSWRFCNTKVRRHEI